ncbi:MAG: zinc dependent phospholipase C family protein [Planctomycetes bacterium]|nr:zinc dependent phospholipase C family protein [Planctomycetota bacterium]
MLLLLSLLFVALVFGWGPGNHLEFSLRVLRARRKLAPGAAALLRDERSAFLYGNIAADLINFKGYGGHYNHCHRWTIVSEMRARAASRAEEAFALGYLAHLAADTIAHNHYVPYHLARYARSKGLGHLYWEMRADGFVPENHWRVVTALKQDRTLDALDQLVNQGVPKKALSMRTNKLLFNHVLLISERDQWRRGVARLHGMSSAPLEPAFLERFRSAAVGRIRLALEPDGLATLLHLDTNGKVAQKSAWDARKQALRRLTRARRERESADAAAPFLVGMESPPPGHGDPHWTP